MGNFKALLQESKIEKVTERRSQSPFAEIQEQKGNREEDSKPFCKNPRAKR